MFARLLAALLLLPCLAQAAPALDPAPPELLQRGEYLARAGDCAACHTAPGGQPFAGGLPLTTPLGAVYSSNITPDPRTGIGSYSYEDFARALREGVARGGLHLYPAMPYTAYAKIGDADMQALYAYFLRGGVEAVAQANRDSDIPWPLNMRWPLAVWNALFHDDRPFQPNPKQSAAWNRGAYLVQGLAHCGTCHTPRGLAFQEKALDEKGSGYLAGAALGGWYAYNITSDTHAGIGGWSDAELAQYLRSGRLPGKAQAAGPMAEAVEHSFQYLRPDDLQAIANYLRSVRAVEDGKRKPRFAWGGPADDVVTLRGEDFDAQTRDDGARLFLGNCASCHGWNGQGTQDAYYPMLSRNTTVGAQQPDNLVQVVLTGVHRESAGQKVFMPGFAGALDDQQIATLVNYLTAQFGNPAVKVDSARVAAIRQP
ncbi:mono/diheme cytochrome c family protein [Pseudomonas citronellolis]|uniref:cytochrome c n=1 Tax=Pseudomonas citronellolis TaxID=53408 RepID=UPI00209CAD20|nr:cytochrome c [Pseudomonas citronellolis]MCP1641605.1 mono/diheme cytochrome c family protein [Pseudomonas citronellolis]MCP1664523.1 mono/diheme cytochrome c family protein [Pseudomonas citronellolis]MCP1695497.1 mono/diheme cytochrome c family protein [Pseudomonas citronellolis]MCP1702358.1 mono/diheme cytochrome c family protein [Pseudomonas citronellolis]MCP1796244.1 mono/diheme cytochrome c family protein [Pseudomonas citronellolis]